MAEKSISAFFLCRRVPVYNYQSMKKRPRKPNGRNIEIALELLELSLILKAALKKAKKKK
jgi:hypothetical protein